MKSNETSLTAGLIPLDWWTRQIKRSPATIWRWRKKGWIQTIAIGNRQYLRAEDAAEFVRRASAGEFSSRKVAGPIQPQN